MILTQRRKFPNSFPKVSWKQLRKFKCLSCHCRVDFQADWMRPSKIVRMIRMWIEACLLELNMNFAKVWPKDFSSEWRFRMKTINSIPYLNLSKVHTWPCWMTLDTSPSHSQMSQVCSGLPTLWELVDIVWLESTMDPERSIPTGPLPKSSPGIVSWPDAWQYLGRGSYRIGPKSWGIERIGSKSEDMRQQLQELDNYIYNYGNFLQWMMGILIHRAVLRYWDGGGAELPQSQSQGLSTRASCTVSWWQGWWAGGWWMACSNGELGCSSPVHSKVIKLDRKFDD